MKCLGLLTLAFVAAGCARNGGNGIAPNPTTFAYRLGCQQVQVDRGSSLEFFVAGQARCTFDGDKVNIRTFTNNEFRDNWLLYVDKYVAHFAVEDRAVLYGEKLPTAQVIVDRIGGHVVRHD